MKNRNICIRRAQKPDIMQDLTVDQILTLHDAIISRDGGDSRLLSEGNIYQMVFRANLLPEVIPRAAFCFYSLVAYPPFREGNVRIAGELATQILNNEGYEIIPAENDQFTRLAEGINLFTTEQEDIETWLLAHVKKAV